MDDGTTTRAFVPPTSDPAFALSQDDVMECSPDPLLSTADIARWQTLIADMGTVVWIEQLIDRRLTCALDSLDSASPAGDAHSALIAMAAACTERMT